MPNRARALLFAALVLSGCEGCATSGTAVSVGSAGSASTPATPAGASSGRSSTGEVDLSIVFDPRVSGSLGWAKLPTEVTLDMIGSPGAEIIDLSRLPADKDDPLRGQIVAAQLGRSSLVDASLVVDPDVLCSAALRDAVGKTRPARLLISVEGGITAKEVTCLRALATSRLYLAGCLHRSHRPDPCDGDAEIHALAADGAVRERIRGLALSLAKPEAVAELAAFPALEYLALSPGAGASEMALVDELPFAALPKVRYLEASGENGHAMALARAEGLRFIAQLHTLRWYGELPFALPSPCRLERVSFGALGPKDVAGLAGCSSLRELSTDEARFDSAKPLAVFTHLERLHLRHFKADDLAALAALAELRSLSLPASKASDYGFVAAMKQLRSVDLSQTSLATLAPLSDLTALESLDVDFTAVGDVTPLRAAEKLVTLSLHETKVVDLATVAKLTSLKELNVSRTPVVDLAPLANHPSLENVLLYESKVTDASALLTLPRLKRAHIKGLSLPAAQVEALRARLHDELLD